MDGWIADLTTKLLWADDLEAARGAFHTIAAEAGLDRFAYAALGSHGGQTYLDATYPDEWVGHYVANDYHSIDPVVQEARLSRLPFAWRFLSHRPLTAAQRRLFDEAAEFGIRDGLTLPFHGKDGSFALLSLAFDGPAQMQKVMGARPKLRLLAVYYHTAVERLLAGPGAADADGLSEREREALSWTARGRTPWDIAAALHLPQDRVAALLRSARERLGAATVAEAIARAQAQGLIEV